jgi:hypothetical protein
LLCQEFWSHRIFTAADLALDRDKFVDLSHDSASAVALLDQGLGLHEAGSILGPELKITYPRSDRCFERLG